MTAANPIPSKKLTTSLYLLILLSGVAGLVYEVVWARQLTLFIGNTATANAAVLTAFMAGLALGSLVLGRVADRIANPLKVYALLEVLIGCYGATTPWLFELMQSGYANVAGVVGVTGPYSHLPRFLIATIAMLIPTFLMGGTLPLLVKHFTRQPDQAPVVTSRVYGINTVGATLGAFSAGFFLLPNLGITSTLLGAALLNLAVGLGVYALLRGSHFPADTGAITSERNSVPVNSERTSKELLILLGFAMSGFAALLYQVVWIHSLILIIGVSIYAFSTVLTVFLTGIGIGSLAVGRFYRFTTTNRAIKLAFYLQLGVALSATVSLSLINQLPVWYVYGWNKFHESFALFQGYSFLLTAGAILIPTILLGALFPIITGIWSQRTGSVGRGVGEAYGANALGTIGGSALGSMLILDQFGIENSLYFASFVSMLVAALFWNLASEERPLLQRWLQLPMLIVVLAVSIQVLPGWDREMMQAQVFRQSDRYEATDIRQAIRRYANHREFLFYKEGIHGTVSVVRAREGDNPQKSLMNNGKIDASTGSDMATQILLGQLPMFTHPNPSDVMIIGLGSGVTAGSVLRNPLVKTMDILEISPEVVEASRFFEDENNRALEDPRAELIIADARNYLLASQNRYDVIISEPSHSWVTGVSNLFTREFLQQTSDHLNPGGIMVQWYHIYGVDRGSLKALLRAVSDVYPHFTLWYIGAGDIIIVSSNEAPQFNYQQRNAFFEQPGIKADLERINVRSIEKLMAYILMSSNETLNLIDGQPANTDDNPIVEFNAPRHIYTATTEDNIRMLLGELHESDYPLPFTNLVKEYEDWIVVPFMGVQLKYERDPYTAPEWNVVRTSAFNPKSGAHRLLGGMNGRMVLHKSWGEVQVHSTMADREAPGSDIMKGLLDYQVPMARDVLAGEMSAANLTIYWRLANSETPGKLKAVLAQRCTRLSGFDSWVAVTSEMLGEVANEDDVKLALKRLSEIMLCLPNPGS